MVPSLQASNWNFVNISYLPMRFINRSSDWPWNDTNAIGEYVNRPYICDYV
jgi:hypothetical protein